MSDRRTYVDEKLGRAAMHHAALLSAISAERLTATPMPPTSLALSYNPDPAVDISLILGDFVHNLSASLDYLIGAMREGGPTKTTAFPICRRMNGADGFAGKRVQNQLEGIPSEAKDLIQLMQPFDGTDTSVDAQWDECRALAALRALWNADKHRMILVAISGIGFGSGSGIDYQFSGAQVIATPRPGSQERRGQVRVMVTLAAQPGMSAEDYFWIESWTVAGLANFMYNSVVSRVVPALRPYSQDA
jgi:hypothetical protein